MTIEDAHTRIRDAWEPGQVYTALSRFRTPDDFTLDCLPTRRQMQPNTRVKGFYETLSAGTAVNGGNIKRPAVSPVRSQGSRGKSGRHSFELTTEEQDGNGSVAGHDVLDCARCYQEEEKPEEARSSCHSDEGEERLRKRRCKEAGPERFCCR